MHVDVGCSNYEIHREPKGLTPEAPIGNTAPARNQDVEEFCPAFNNMYSCSWTVRSVMTSLDVVIDKSPRHLTLGHQVVRQSEKRGIIEIRNRGGSFEYRQKTMTRTEQDEVRIVKSDKGRVRMTSGGESRVGLGYLRECGRAVESHSLIRWQSRIPSDMIRS